MTFLYIHDCIDVLNQVKMVVWSSIFRAGIKPAQISTILKTSAIPKPSQYALQLRHMSEQRHLHITASRFQWHKFKDLIHFYVMVGLIPVCSLVFFVNVLVGPAQLTAIPEGYTPKHYEYFKHPISRFLARYIYPSPQQDYEKMCQVMYEETELQQIRKLGQRVQSLIAERNDYEAYYYRPVTAKYARLSREGANHIMNIWSDM